MPGCYSFVKSLRRTPFKGVDTCIRTLYSTLRTMTIATPAPPVHTPTPQGVNHPTFRPAKYDHGLSIPGLYEHHAEHSPEHPVFTYSDLETGASHDITYREAWYSIGAVASIVNNHVRGTEAGERHVIGVLAMSGTHNTSGCTFPSSQRSPPRHAELHLRECRDHEPWPHRVPAIPTQ